MLFGNSVRTKIYTCISIAFVISVTVLELNHYPFPKFNPRNIELSVAVTIIGLITLIYQLTRTFEKQKTQALVAIKQEQEIFIKNTAQVPGTVYQFQLFKDGTSRYLHLTDSAKELLNVDIEAVKQNPDLLFNRIEKEDLITIRKSLLDSIKTKENWRYVYRLNTKGKPVKWISGNAKPEAQEDGSTIWYGYAYDFTEEKNTEQILLKSQDNFNLIANTINDVFYLYDNTKNEYLFISPNCENVLGVEQQYFYSGSNNYTKKSVHPDDLQKLKKASLQMQDGLSYDIDFRVIINGRTAWLNEKSYPIKNEKGKIIKYSGVITDITLRKLAEESLIESQHNILQISSTINDVFFLYDCINKKYLFVSSACKTVLGVDDTFFYEGKNYTENFAHPADRQMLQDAYETIGDGGEYDLEYRIFINKEIKWLREKSFAIKNDAGEVLKISGIIADVTAEKRNAEKLVKSQTAFEEAQHLANVGSWEYSFFDKKCMWSKEMYRIFEMGNLPPEELFDHVKTKIFPADVVVAEKGIIKVIGEGGVHSIEIKFVGANGQVKYISVIAEPILSLVNKKVIGIKGAVQDITKQKLAAMAKSNFLSTMSHEIRTPINGVIGITNLLLEEDLTAIQKEYINTLNFSAQHLTTIVSDILDFSKIESGNFTFEKVSFNLEQVCQNIFKLFQSSAKEKDLQYEFVPAPIEEFSLYGDHVRLSQVLSNLLSNAIKFTQQGSVHFSYSVKEQTDKNITITFIIKDSGIGITPIQQGRIFESFLQADDTVTRMYGGTGLGLTISKRLVEMQQGKIFVESEYGRGSAFSVEIAFDKHSFTDEKFAAAHLVKTDKTILNGMKILVAEDNKINAMVLVRFLDKWKITSKIAGNGQKAVDILQEEDFDLVLMDLQMPVLDGREATKVIRNLHNKKINSIPIVALTADALIESQRALLNNGFNDCITKPFNPDTLFKMLQKYHLQ